MQIEIYPVEQNGTNGNAVLTVSEEKGWVKARVAVFINGASCAHIWDRTGEGHRYIGTVWSDGRETNTSGRFADYMRKSDA